MGCSAPGRVDKGVQTQPDEVLQVLSQGGVSAPDAPRLRGRAQGREWGR